jgi:hypothetical protein
MKLSSWLYNLLKWVALIGIPTAAYAYNELGPVWSLPYVDQVTQTLLIAAMVIGSLIGVSQLTIRQDNKALATETGTTLAIAEEPE